MDPDARGDKRQLAFVRFGLSGLVFTVLGPSIFWMAYPLGPLVAVAIAEVGVHSLRFLTFRTVVFPADEGYRVSLPRYIVSALPVSLACVVTVGLLSNKLDRAGLTFSGAMISLLIGFFWSRFVYTKPIRIRCPLVLPQSADHRRM
jgi:hypothetical protein